MESTARKVRREFKANPAHKARRGLRVLMVKMALPGRLAHRVFAVRTGLEDRPDRRVRKAIPDYLAKMVRKGRLARCQIINGMALGFVSKSRTEGGESTST